MKNNKNYEREEIEISIRLLLKVKALLDFENEMKTLNTKGKPKMYKFFCVIVLYPNIISTILFVTKKKKNKTKKKKRSGLREYFIEKKF